MLWRNRKLRARRRQESSLLYVYVRVCGCAYELAADHDVELRTAA